MELYYRQQANICPDQLCSEITSTLVSPICEYVRIDNDIDLTIAFLTLLTPAQEITLDSVIAAHVCSVIGGGLIPPVVVNGEEVYEGDGLTLKQDDTILMGNVDTINLTGNGITSVTTSTSANLINTATINISKPSLPENQIWIGDATNNAVPTIVEPTTLTTLTNINAIAGDTLVFNGTTWVQSNLIGMSHQLVFGDAGTVSDEWLDAYGDNKTSNKTTAVIPFNSKLVGITFSNYKTNVGADILIYSTQNGGGNSPKDLKYTWTINNKRTAFKTSFATDVLFNAGEKLGIYFNKTNKSGQNVNVILYFMVIDDTVADDGENWSGYYGTEDGGGDHS